MQLFLKIKQWGASIVKGFRRFPVPIAIAFVAMVLFVTLNHITDKEANLYILLRRILMAVGAGFPLSISITLFFERKSATAVVQALAYFAGAILLAGYCLAFLPTGDTTQETMRYAMLVVSFVLISFCVPYYLSRDRFELYSIRMVQKFLVTALYGGVLHGGIAAILYAIDWLLKINVTSDTYTDVAILVWVVVAPIYFLSTIPKRDYQPQEQDFSKVLRVLILYIVMPIILAYTAVLYVYFVTQWPSREVVHMVLWYALAVVAVLLCIYPLKKENKWSGVFSTYMPYVTLIPMVILFISMIIRISAYGFTVPRCIVLFVSVWVTGSLIFFAVKRSRYNIWLPITLVVVLLLTAFGGPISAYGISVASQNQRLENILQKNHMIQNGKVVSPKEALSQTDQSEISSILSYFDREHHLADVNVLPKNTSINEAFDLLSIKEPIANPIEEQYVSYYLQRPLPVVSVAGYDYLFEVQNQSSFTKGDTLVNISYDHNSQQLMIFTQQNTILFEKNLWTYAEQLKDRYGIIHKEELSVKDMTFEEENSDIKIKLIFYSISGRYDESTDMSRSMDFILLVKVKK